LARPLVSLEFILTLGGISAGEWRRDADEDGRAVGTGGPCADRRMVLGGPSKARQCRCGEQSTAGLEHRAPGRFGCAERIHEDLPVSVGDCQRARRARLHHGGPFIGLLPVLGPLSRSIPGAPAATAGHPTPW